jgi:hypothetical protein
MKSAELMYLTLNKLVCRFYEHDLSVIVKFVLSKNPI